MAPDEDTPEEEDRRDVLGPTVVVLLVALLFVAIRCMSLLSDIKTAVGG